MSLLAVLTAIAILLAIATLVGTRLPKTHVAASRQRLEATVDEVWESVTNFADYPTWRPGLSRVEPGPVIDGNPSWFECCAPGIKVQLQFAEYEPKTRLVSRLVGDALPIFGAWEYEFVEDGGGTLLTITEKDKVYNPLLRFFTRFVFPHHAPMDVYLIALARHCGGQGEPVHLSVRISEEEPVATHTCEVED